jgi:hypothetical protein
MLPLTVTRGPCPVGHLEALMTYALYWVHVPLASALAAVVIYRGFNFWSSPHPPSFPTANG